LRDKNQEEALPPLAIARLSSDFALLPSSTQPLAVDGSCLPARPDFVNCEVKARTDADP